MRWDQAEVPHQLKDEDKWFTFTKPELFKFLGVMFIPTVLFKILSNLGHWVVGAVIFGIIALVSMILIKGHVPEENYLFGSGKPLYAFFFFWLKGKFSKKREVYSRCVEEIEGEK